MSTIPYATLQTIRSSSWSLMLDSTALGESSAAVSVPPYEFNAIIGGVPNGSNRLFTLPVAPSPAQATMLFVGGLLQKYGADFSVSGPSITMTYAPSAGTVLQTAFPTATFSLAGYVYPTGVTGAINGSNRTFTLPSAPSSPVMLFVNGQLQKSSYDFSVSGQTLTMTWAPSSGSVLQVVYTTLASAFPGYVWPSALTGTQDGVNRTFALPQTPSSSSYVMLWLNGILLNQGYDADYTVAGGVVTFNSAPSSTAVIQAAFPTVGTSSTATGAGIGQVAQGLADVHQCLKIIFGTIPGEDPFRPTFGCDLTQFLDLPINVAMPALVAVSSAAIQKWEPRITIESITATYNPNVSGQLVVSLIWKPNLGSTNQQNAMIGSETTTFTVGG